MQRWLRLSPILRRVAPARRFIVASDGWNRGRAQWQEGGAAAYAASSTFVVSRGRQRCSIASRSSLHRAAGSRFRNRESALRYDVPYSTAHVGTYSRGTHSTSSRATARSTSRYATFRSTIPTFIATQAFAAGFVPACMAIPAPIRVRPFSLFPFDRATARRHRLALLATPTGVGKVSFGTEASLSRRDGRRSLRAVHIAQAHQPRVGRSTRSHLRRFRHGSGRLARRSFCAERATHA